MAESRTAACLWLLVAACVTVAGLQAVPDRFVAHALVPQVKDVDTYAAIIERLQAGESYYHAVGAGLRAGGYATWPLVNWRTPLHFSAVASFGLDAAGKVLTALATAAILVAFLGGLRVSISRGLGLAVAVLGAMLPALISRPSGVLMPEVWTGALIGLSLGCYTVRRWTLAAVIGVLAVFVRELAAPYALICGVLALTHKRRHESAVWIIGGLAYMAYYGLHIWHASAAVQPGDVVNAHSWLQFLGLPFLLHTLQHYGWLLALASPPLTAIVLGLSVVALAAPSMPSQVRVTTFAYALLFLCVGQPFDVYWGFVTAPLWGFTIASVAQGAQHLLTTAVGDLRAAEPIRE